MTQTVVVTGANRGIGLELVRAWKGRGDEVIAVCRKSSDELQDLGVQIIEDVDVSQPSSLNHLRKSLEGTRIDVLFNCAGIMRSETLDDMNYDQIREQFEVNTIGPLHTTLALLDLIPEGGRVAMMTSRMGSIEDNTSGGKYGYRASKAALNAVSKSLAVDLHPQGIAVAILHPGYVKTDMTGHTGHITPQESAERLVQRVDELNLDNSGTFWHSDGSILPW
ncbi:SDR family oxidoreductase [Marinobacteraceae bacterium S3BR75-40.1]